MFLPSPITPTLTSSSVHHSSHQLTTTFLSPAHEVGAGDIVITMSGRAAVWPCVRVSFPDDISESVSQIAFILHTDIP